MNIAKQISVPIIEYEIGIIKNRRAKETSFDIQENSHYFFSSELKSLFYFDKLPRWVIGFLGVSLRLNGILKGSPKGSSSSSDIVL